MASSAREDKEPTNSGEEGHNRDVDAMDQEGDGTIEDEERDANAEAQQSEPPRQPRRRKRTVTQWPNDKLTVMELTPVGIPT